MSVEDNKQLAVRFLDDMGRRGPELFADLTIVTEDFVWWAQSLGRFDREQMIARYAKVGELFAGPGARTIKTVTAEGDRVAVEYTGDTPLRNGGRYQNTYLSLFVIRDGRVAMVREYCDTAVTRSALG
ncbi:MAG: SnoaL-like domain protein [Phenylobacterium sp.]|nr:SnoaL-like domain protein [Phenylobacterium sp.]